MNESASPIDTGSGVASSSGLIKTAWEQYRSGAHQQALATLQDALRTDPKSAPIHVEIARMYQEMKDSGKTIEYCAKALKLAPPTSLAYQLMGFAYILRRQTDKAVPLLRKAIEIDPDNICAYEDLGNIVLAATMTVVDMDPNYLQASISVGRDAAVDIRLLEDAIKYRQRGCNNNWQWLCAYYRMGMLYYYAQNREELRKRIVVAAKGGHGEAQEWLEEISKQPRGLESLGFREAVDLTSEKEKQIAVRAYAGDSLGDENDLLVAELIEIGRKDDYLSENPGGRFDEKRRHMRTREIGQTLNDRGGNELMQAACYRVKAALGSGPARMLEMAWGYIGEWLP